MEPKSIVGRNFSLNKKLMIILTTAIAMVIVLISLETVLASIVVPKTQKFSIVLEGEKPTVLFLRSQGKEIVVAEKEEVQQFHKQVENKMATRVSVSKTRKFQGNMIAIINYNSDKGMDMVIDEKGKIFIVVGKGSIRNKSKLHWLWWKLNGLHDNYTYLYYYTGPDQKVVDMIHDMKSIAGLETK